MNGDQRPCRRFVTLETSIHCEFSKSGSITPLHGTRCLIYTDPNKASNFEKSPEIEFSPSRDPENVAGRGIWSLPFSEIRLTDHAEINTYIFNLKPKKSSGQENIANLQLK